MPRTVPPKCRDCGAPGQWTYKGESKRNAREWILVDAASMSDAERLEKVAYDGARHVTHVCAKPAPAAAAPAIDARTYLAGQALAWFSHANPDAFPTGDTEAAVRVTAEIAVRLADAVLAELAKAPSGT